MSNLPTEEHNVSGAWLKLHRRHLPVILGIASINILVSLLIHFFTPGQSMWQFHQAELVFLTDLIVLPLAAVNSIFLTRRIFKKPIQSGWKLILSKSLATVLGVMLTSIVLENIYLSLGFQDDDYLFFGNYRVSASMTNVIEYSIASLFIGLPVFIWQSRFQGLNYKLREREIEQERLTRLKTQAELHALQSRINPHFLFNSFNSIASLISTDPQKAEKMMVQLSELFRYSLNSQESNFVALEEELHIVETYLGIEKVRFGENLNYRISVPPDLAHCLIPRFLIQPLVENAVKHATSRVKQGEIRLEVESFADKLYLRLYDNGPVFPMPIRKGYGLQSTFDKLQLLYPGQHTIEFINKPEKYIGICFKLTNPHEREIYSDNSRR